MSEPYYSRVYTDRPAYADFDAPQKFNAIQSIIAKRIKEHAEIENQIFLFNEDLKTIHVE